MKVKPLNTQEADEQIALTGLLFAINYLVLHPTGLVLVFSGETLETMVDVRFARQVDGQPIEFAEDLKADAKRRLREFAEAQDRGSRFQSAMSIILDRLDADPGTISPTSQLHREMLRQIMGPFEQRVVSQLHAFSNQRNAKITARSLEMIVVPPWLFEVVATLQQTQNPIALGAPLVPNPASTDIHIVLKEKA